MVFLVLQRHYTAFANVRIAILPQDLGETGELRLALLGNLQHRIYRPQSSYKYTSIPVHLIDIARTRMFGCEVRLLTYLDYEYWFRFPSRADAVIFYRVLRHRLDRVMQGEYDSDEEDYWEEGTWTVHDVGSEPVECQCSCHQRTRYTRARTTNHNNRS